jgi:hypothetical protein
MSNLKALIEGARKQAHKVLIELRQDSLTPFYHLVVPGDGKDIVIATSWADEAEKVAAIAAVAATAEVVGAVAVLFVGEAWMSVYDTKGMTSWHRDRLLANAPPPSQNPQRKEVVFAVATDGEHTEAAR